MVVEGNTIYCSIENFKKYANYKGFFCYQNIDHNESKFKSGRVLVNIPVKIAYRGSTQSYDDSLVDSNGYQFWIKNSVIFNDNRVYGLADICYDGGTTDLIQIFDRQFWCKEQYMNEVPKEQPQIPNTVGQNRILKQASIIYQNSNLTGLKYNYKINTSIVILENISSTIDKVKVNATGRVGYIKNNSYK